MKNFYITTAIDYANGSPHLGHAYEKVLTDIIARFRRLKGDRVFFLTGLDEHGQKVQQTAEKQGIEPQAFCDQVAVEFQRLCKELEISNDDFIRTTEPRHKEVVGGLLQSIYDKGEIYRNDYHGFYSTRQEQFLQEKDKVDGKWPEIFGEVIEITEPNYFFKLSAYQDWLIDFLKTNPDFIFPRFRQKQVLEFLKEPLNDLCISRPKERLSWGIPLPFDQDFVTYVWFDALTNYITAPGYGTDQFEENWPADFHVIGKDILVPPHAVYWPIMLHAAGIPLPKSLLVHGWWNISGEKMSKSLGNIVNPLELVERFGPDPLRYFFAREMTVGQDSDFSPDQFLTRYTDDLGNDLGNLVSRLLNMGGRYTDQKVPVATVNDEPEQELQKKWSESRDKALEHCEDFAFHRYLDETFAFIRGINRYAELRAPWKLAKSEDPADKARLETSLATMAEGLRLAAVLLTPVTPSISEKILTLLGEKEVELFESNLDWCDRLVGNKLGEKTILFPRPQ
ncbi:methionine--tRNA ligase [Rubellicoccus peritrichatus]|uniref:Methionine--tRNA ligase n=1 Tax=Rubellicoccus peritrichatus TaxID=3080537 RepID=A0AAQ3QU54_9BACT|nr:methionine--tRNA ligase [Puniceicoccus sp. CR14]WOO40113.1 methionine--tRNA ligase [Puniceicoccus sp. CR14]